MSDLTSGDFVRMDRDNGQDEYGLVLLTSSNKREDGDTEDWVEVLGPIEKQLLRADKVRPFHEDEQPDPNEIKSSSATDVTGVGQKSRPTPKTTTTNPTSKDH